MTPPWAFFVVMLHDWWWILHRQVPFLCCWTRKALQALPCNSDGNHDKHDFGKPELQHHPVSCFFFSLSKMCFIKESFCSWIREFKSTTILSEKTVFSNFRFLTSTQFSSEKTVRSSPRFVEIDVWSQLPESGVGNPSIPLNPDWFMTGSFSWLVKIPHGLLGRMSSSPFFICKYTPEVFSRLEHNHEGGWFRSLLLSNWLICRFQPFQGVNLPPNNLTIPSMYGIFTYIWLIFMVNVGKYTIHGWYG